MSTSRKQLKVYVAGSSNLQERGRVKTVLAMVEGHPNMQLTYDWVASKEAYENMHDSSLPFTERPGIASMCAVGALAADVLWFLAPDFTTNGAWFEAGMVDGWNFAQGTISNTARGGPRRRIEVFASGPTRQSVFCSRMREFETDRDAYFELCAFADRFVAGGG